ncbi:MAG: tetratricopeptide repeat protein, partial [Deltaproteobacteria bacterium]|nr:tetratricopeptide repeat protein [Deltaproteobacteria bacterium]
MEKALKTHSSCLKIILMMLFGIFFIITCAKKDHLSTRTKEDQLNELNHKAVILFEQGRYSEAAKVAEEALAVAEKTLGPDHPDVATSLNNLA